jgi:hypothetical protein
MALLEPSTEAQNGDGSARWSCEGERYMTATGVGALTSTTAYEARLSTHPASMGWLAVVVALSVIAILVLGTMAQDRWCGPELCSVSVEQY